MLKVFRSLLLNLPTNPKCGKTRARQLPSMKNFFFGLSKFSRQDVEIFCLSARLRPPLVYWDLYVYALQSSVLFTLKLH